LLSIFEIEFGIEGIAGQIDTPNLAEIVFLDELSARDGGGVGPVERIEA
jgi:hypothetical protein